MYFSLKNKKKSNLPHSKLLQTAFAIIQRLKPRKFKDVHLNKCRCLRLIMIESHDSLFSQIVAKLYTTSELRITFCDDSSF